MNYIKDIFYSAVFGLLALVLLRVFDFYTGVSLPLSYINGAVSVLLGIPGVIAALIFRWFIL